MCYGFSVCFILFYSKERGYRELSQMYIVFVLSGYTVLRSRRFWTHENVLSSIFTQVVFCVRNHFIVNLNCNTRACECACVCACVRVYISSLFERKTDR